MDIKVAAANKIRHTLLTSRHDRLLTATTIKTNPTLYSNALPSVNFGERAVRTSPVTQMFCDSDCILAGEEKYAFICETCNRSSQGRHVY
jgi:hypothetical protein